ncbi:MAG: ABC transporter substrate-binding protein, partial [Acidimicrobiia bacterium]
MMRSRTSRALVAPLVALALVAAACGGDDDSADEPDTEEPAGEPADDGGDEPADDGGDEPSEEPPAEPSEEPADGSSEEPSEEPAEEPAMAPQRGGTLTYLLEAESDTWDIPGANCAVACITVMRQVMDPLTIVNENGEIEPFLLESFEPNEDFTEFTLTMREDVTFRDGTPADGAAVQRSLTEMANGILQGQVFWDLANGSLFSDPAGTPADSIELVDPMTVRVSFARPYALFGNVIAERTGWLIAPSFWDNPDRAGALPVGTGPFQMVEWTRGEATVLEANPNYWRTDPNGEPLPYLDSIVFRPVPDVAARRATMEAGDADVNQDSFGENREFWNGEWLENGGQIVTPAPDRETSYLMFNNSVPPFDNPEMRRAVAHCTNRQEVLDFRAVGAKLTDGPFSEGSLGYVADPGFPQFDPEAGNAILDEIGRPEAIVYGTT